MKPQISAQQQPELSIVVPAYSEEKRIGGTLDELASFLQQDAFFGQKNVEVLVVSADSADKTHEIVRSKQGVFKNLTLLAPGPKVGKGRDVQYGMLRASGKVRVFMDADLATPLHHLRRLYDAVSVEGVDVAVGTRNLYTYRSNAFRGAFAYLGNRLYQLLSGIHIEDTQCGFKMFSERATELCFSKLTILGWDFDFEILAIARANRLVVKGFRVDDWADMPYSTYTVGALQISWRMSKDFARVALNQLRGVYKRP